MMDSPDSKWTVGWGITSACDLRCPFCYSRDARARGDISDLISQSQSFLLDNRDRIHAINFGTGESFLSPAFPTLIQRCSEILPSVPLAVTTNGAAVDIDKRTLTEITSKITECDISLDFADPPVFDAWRGKPGAWHRAVRALAYFSGTELVTSLVMVGTAQTLTGENLEEMFKMADCYGVALRINFYMPTTSDMFYAPSREQVYLSLGMLADWAWDMRTSDPLFRAQLHQNDMKPAGRSCRILPDGFYSPSTYLVTDPWLTKFTITQEPLDALSTAEPFIRYQTPVLPEECASCMIKNACGGGSIERRWLYEGNLDKRDPYCPGSMIGSPGKHDTPSHWDGPVVHLGYLPTVVAIGSAR